MWQYEKKLQYPVNIKNPDPRMAKIIISQLGGRSSKKIYSLSDQSEREFYYTYYTTYIARVQYVHILFTLSCIVSP